MTRDAIIVGGGATGASVLFHLAQAGVRNVVLLERATFACGPTGRSPAVLRQHYARAILVQMAKYSLELFRSWKEVFESPCGFVPCGFFAAAGPRNAEHLLRVATLQRAQGVRVERIMPGELRSVFPQMQVDDLVAAVFEPDAGYCDPSLAVATMIRQARRLGASAEQGVCVRELLVRGGTIAGVATDAGEVHAPIVVVAAGPWSAALAAAHGARVPIDITRHGLWSFGQAPLEAPVEAVFADHVSGIYIRPDSGGTCLVGSLRRSDGRPVEDPDRFDEGVGLDDTIDVAQRFARRLPRWSGAQVRTGWSSLFDETPDGTPIVGELSPVRGLFVAAGMSGHGFKLCPAVARCVVDRILGRQSPWMCSELAVERFDTGQPDTPGYVYD